MLTKSPVMHGTALSSRWVLALTILLGQVTLAFSMFAVAVALPNIMNALSADVSQHSLGHDGFSNCPDRAHARPGMAE